jgi:hypothetical protein
LAEVELERLLPLYAPKKDETAVKPVRTVKRAGKK